MEVTEKEIVIRWIEFVQKLAYDANKYDLDVLFDDVEDIKTYALQALHVLYACGLDIEAYE
jgi:hypothetical protein